MYAIILLAVRTCLFQKNMRKVALFHNHFLKQASPFFNR